MGLFDKIKKAFSGNKEKEEVVNYDKGLEKSRREFVSQLSNLSKKYKNINEDYFEELENILIMADIGINTVMTFVDRLKERVKKEKITDSGILKEIIVDELFVMYVGNNIIDSKISIYIGRSSYRRTFYDNTGPDNGLAFFIDYLTGNRTGPFSRLLLFGKQNNYIIDFPLECDIRSLQ